MVGALLLPAYVVEQAELWNLIRSMHCSPFLYYAAVGVYAFAGEKKVKKISQAWNASRLLADNVSPTAAYR